MANVRRLAPLLPTSSPVPSFSDFLFALVLSFLLRIYLYISLFLLVQRSTVSLYVATLYHIIQLINSCSSWLSQW